MGGGQWELTGRAVTTDPDPDVDGLSGRAEAMFRSVCHTSDGREAIRFVRVGM